MPTSRFPSPAELRGRSLTFGGARWTIVACGPKKTMLRNDDGRTMQVATQKIQQAFEEITEAAECVDDEDFGAGLGNGVRWTCQAGWPVRSRPSGAARPAQVA